MKKKQNKVYKIFKVRYLCFTPNCDNFSRIKNLKEPSKKE